jgi:hypothetical protein
MFASQETAVMVTAPPNGSFTLEEIALKLSFYRQERLFEAAILDTEAEVKEQEIDLGAELAGVCQLFCMPVEMQRAVIGEYAAEVLGL